MGDSQIYDSSAAFELKSLESILPRISRGLQIGSTGRSSADANEEAIGIF
jgi:hypothetical protein